MKIHHSRAREIFLKFFLSKFEFYSEKLYNFSQNNVKIIICPLIYKLNQQFFWGISIKSSKGLDKLRKYLLNLARFMLKLKKNENFEKNFEIS